MLWTFFLICSHSFIFDSIYVELQNNFDCSEETEGDHQESNVFINLLRPCNWDDAYLVGGSSSEGEYYLYLEHNDFPQNLHGDPRIVDGIDCSFEEGCYHIGSESEQEEQTVNPGDSYLIASHDASEDLSEGANDFTDLIFPCNLRDDEDNWEYEWIWLLFEDADFNFYVIDTYDLNDLQGRVAKRNYEQLALESTKAEEDCETDQCWDSAQWGMGIYGYKETTWYTQAATSDPMADVGTIPAEACVEDENGGEEEEEDSSTDSPTEDSSTNSPTMGPTKNPTRPPTMNPTMSPTNEPTTSTTNNSNQSSQNTGDSSTNSSKSVTSEVWFFIVLFIAGMAACGFFMYFCKRGESVDAGFIAAADYEEGLHAAAPGGRGSLILMQPVAKNLAMMDGEEALFDDDGMGDTPSASRVRESRIVKQREGEIDQNLEGLPTGHQIIKASQISNERRSIGSFDSEPGSEPGSLPGSIISKRTPQTDEVGEVDITSLE